MVDLVLIQNNLLYGFISQPHSHVLKPKLDADSEEYVIEQLSQAEQKVVNLAEELSSRDLETIHKEMEDEEVCIIYTLYFVE